MFREIDLKSAFSSDLERGAEFDFDDDTGPERAAPDDVCFLLQLDIGTKEDCWAECFSVWVVTPNNRPRRTPDTRYIEVPRYSFPVLRDHVTKAIAACQRDSWEESLKELRKRFLWEYEPGRSR
ncbi:Imm8 family immunity protein [Sinorhizobium chiapasense]